MKCFGFFFFGVCLILLSTQGAQAGSEGVVPVFGWPKGAQAAVSLSFDDARASQIPEGLPLLKEYGIKATFYVIPDRVAEQLEGWKQAVADGQEIGNHTLNHPCTGNFDWAKNVAIENYSLDSMRAELVEANRRIRELLGVSPETFAYPCDHTSVGRGKNTKSYVPLVAELFVAGRGWNNETTNDPLVVDLSQVMAMPMDNTDFASLRAIIEEAKAKGRWVVLAGHEVGVDGPYTTKKAVLRELLTYLQASEPDLWVAPVGVVARYVASHPSVKPHGD